MPNLKFQKKVLSNGVRLITAPMPWTEAVTVLVLFGVGSRYEAASLNGASHFLEHLMFKGTLKRPTTLDISRELDRVGAEYNAYTSKDHTGYWVTVAAKHLDLACDVVFDMLLNSKFEAAELERERQVILEEIKMYEENPLMHIDDLFDAALFGDTPLGWKISGTRESMLKIKRDKLLDFKNCFYGPNNAVVVVAGNFHGDISKKIGKYLSGYNKSCQRPSFKKAVLDHKKQIALHFQKLDQTQLALGFPAYQSKHSKLPALKMMNLILGGNMSSRLFIEVRERRGLAYYVRSEVDTFADTGSFKVRAGLDAARLEEALKVILDELRKIRDGVTAKELDDAKECARGRLALSLEDSVEQAEWCGKQETLLGEILTPKQKLAELEHVTLGDIKNVAQEIIRPNKLHCALIGPWKDDNKLSKLLKL